MAVVRKCARLKVRRRKEDSHLHRPASADTRLKLRYKQPIISLVDHPIGAECLNYPKSKLYGET